MEAKLLTRIMGKIKFVNSGVTVCMQIFHYPVDVVSQLIFVHLRARCVNLPLYHWIWTWFMSVYFTVDLHRYILQRCSCSIFAWLLCQDNGHSGLIK